LPSGPFARGPSQGAVVYISFALFFEAEARVKYKDVKIQLKEKGDEGMFSGYAAVFNNTALDWLRRLFVDYSKSSDGVRILDCAKSSRLSSNRRRSENIITLKKVKGRHHAYQPRSSASDR
jgi:hypothetical protein